MVLVTIAIIFACMVPSGGKCVAFYIYQLLSINSAFNTCKGSILMHYNIML